MVDGDVNQGFAGLQIKYGKGRYSDSGIRETAIIGQGIGLAMRGLRPIAEIQYLDYLLYAIQTLSDDLASLQYRTAGQQVAPLIVRTRGHRLEGIWQSGSPMGTTIHAFTENHNVLRNMVHAIGMYEHFAGRHGSCPVNRMPERLSSQRENANKPARLPGSARYSGNHP